MLASELEAVRSKLQGYAARIATLETDLAQAQQALQALQREEDGLVSALSALLQKLTVAEKRVYGSLLDELGVESLQQLETEMVGKLRENEAMQAECRTHIALLQTKKKYGRERLQSAQRELAEQAAARSKASRRLEELRGRAESEDAGLRALDEELEAAQVAIVKVQRRIREEEGRIGVVDARIREVNTAAEPVTRRNEARRRSWTTRRRACDRRSPSCRPSGTRFSAPPRWNRSRFRCCRGERARQEPRRRAREPRETRETQERWRWSLNSRRRARGFPSSTRSDWRWRSTRTTR